LTVQEWIFLVLGVTGTGAALRLVTSKNVVHAALYLVVTLAAVGGVYLLLAAEFVAWVQVLIYVGAIVVLLLFGLMLTRAPIGREALDNQQRGFAVVVGVGILAGLAVLLWDAFGDARIDPGASNTAGVGTNLFESFVLPFEVVSFLLLAALIGAIVLARRDEDVSATDRSRPPRSLRREEAVRR
jgi:NADH-quinone oxidoreductase subunit J